MKHTRKKETDKKEIQIIIWCTKENFLIKETTPIQVKTNNPAPKN